MISIHCANVLIVPSLPTKNDDALMVIGVVFNGDDGEDNPHFQPIFEAIKVWEVLC